MTLATIGLAVLPGRLAASPCEAVVGKWTWFTNGVVTINPNGTIVHDPGNDGTWECTDPSHNRITVHWRIGGFGKRDGALSRRPKPFEHRSNPAVRDGTTHGPAPTPQAAVPVPLPPPERSPLPAPPASVPSSTGDGTDPFVRGRKLAESGHCADAIPYYDKALQANPRYAKAYSDRGRCYARLGNLPRGLQDLDGQSRPHPTR